MPLINLLVGSGFLNPGLDPTAPRTAAGNATEPAAASADRPRMSLALQSFLPFPNSCQGTSPHQQGRGTKMKEHYYGGIDVAKDRLDVQVLPHRQRFSVDNNATGWAELVAQLHALPIAAVGIEPSGGYERGIIRTLPAAGLR